MKIGVLIYGFFGLLIGLVIGFWIANAVNRNLSPPLVNQNPISLQQTAAPENSGEKLSPEEIKAAFAAAENRKEDAVFQKNLGLALSRYAKVQNDSSFLPELITLLERANRLSNEKDTDVLAALGDVYFIDAQEKFEARLYEKTRNLYQRAIRLNPGNADIKTAYASTFLFSKPANPEAAITELKSILNQNPNNEEALQLLILALIQSNKIETAEQKLYELKKINSNNPAIPDLEAQLTQNKIKINGE
ncbi:MAG TPA: tetratricopeptide repeat protein [Pyrinomonadaceae bacterium]